MTENWIAIGALLTGAAFVVYLTWMVVRGDRYLDEPSPDRARNETQPEPECPPTP